MDKPLVENPMRPLLRAIKADLGVVSNQQGGASYGVPSVPAGAVDFETGVDGDGNDTDFMIWGEDNWGDASKLW
jgi:hypothetical protein